MKTLVFGPVPSRRLGKSLGINNIPPKTCSYSCVYCQLGKTSHMLVNRQAFFEPEDILMQVKRKVDEAALRNEGIDYLTFVPDGEPTLDVNIGKEISLLKHLGIPIAVITNASLLWQEIVREDLLAADFVSLKVDAISQNLWRRINRPHKSLRLDTILDGIKKFAETFEGALVSETMLIDAVNYKSEFEKMANFLGSLAKLDKAYVAIPTRPPTEKWVKPAKEEAVNAAFQTFAKRLGSDKVEYLIGYEGNAFAFTGDIKEDLLSIMAVHPMRKEAVAEFLKKANTDWKVIEKLLKESKLIELEYEGKKYYMRKLHSQYKS
jgi:wyosine [tRNA(Phe)-imidazoG37] synthetase (radical SAM superfamily)